MNAHDFRPDNVGEKLQKFLSQRNSATAALQELCTAPIRTKPLYNTSFFDHNLINSLHLSQYEKKSLVVRHVRLQSHDIGLSEAWNSYVPLRLTEETRQILKDDRIPFGHAVGEKNFYREKISSSTQGLPKEFVLENRALLRRYTDGMPIAALIERYTVAAYHQLIQYNKK